MLEARFGENPKLTITHNVRNDLLRYSLPESFL